MSATFQRMWTVVPILITPCAHRGQQIQQSQPCLKHTFVRVGCSYSWFCLCFRLPWRCQASLHFSVQNLCSGWAVCISDDFQMSRVRRQLTNRHSSAITPLISQSSAICSMPSQEGLGLQMLVTQSLHKAGAGAGLDHTPEGPHTRVPLAATTGTVSV